MRSAIQVWIADQAIPAIEGLGLNAVHVARQPQQVGCAGVQHEGIVLDHQVMGQRLRVEPVHGLSQGLDLRRPVGIVAVDRLAPVTARSPITDGAEEVDAR